MRIYYEIPGDTVVMTRREGGDTTIKCVICVFQRGDRASTLCSERTSTRRYSLCQPQQDINPEVFPLSTTACEKLTFLEGNLGTQRFDIRWGCYIAI